MVLINALVTESQRLAQGVTPLIISSQNVGGFDNDDVYRYFQVGLSRCKNGKGFREYPLLIRVSRTSYYAGLIKPP